MEVDGAELSVVELEETVTGKVWESASKDFAWKAA